MLSKVEFTAYKGIVESEDTQKTLESQSPDAISRLGGEMAVYYARLSGELADIKDEGLGEFLQLVKGKDEGGLGMSAARAEKEAEAIVNSRHEVTRRQVQYLMEALDKIGFACSARVRSFNKEGSF